MTVAELQAILDDLDPDMEVIFDDISEGGRCFVTTSRAKVIKGEDIYALWSIREKGNLPEAYLEDKTFFALEM